MRKYLQTLTNPTRTALHLLGRCQPAWLWRRHSRLARAAGLKKLYLVLSFDCDTPEDAAVVLELDERLRDMGLNPAYAVPGALLERAEKVYSRLLRRGAEFLNHGYTQHTYWNVDAGRYESCFFYDQLPRERVRQDIEEGHRSVTTVLGRKPAGFRVPHFGTFQSRAQLRFLHAVLKPLGYRYSSSTLPWHGFGDGPVSGHYGVLEFPVSGTFSHPLVIQDSWGFYAAPDRRRCPEDFLAEARAIADFARREPLVGILNYYADPAHVWDQPTFFAAVAAWKEVAEPATLEALCSPSR